MSLSQINYLPNIDGESALIILTPKTLVDITIERLKFFEPLTKGEGFFFADSYGKDSCVARRLLQMAGSKYDGHYSRSGIDPPELVLFGRENHPEVMIEKPEMSVWQGIAIKGMPRRQSRWCCELIKEKRGSGRIVVTGIRWAESSRRKSRRMFEVCQSDSTKYFLNPLIDWTEKDVWNFIHTENIPYCSLYDEMYWNPRKKKTVRRFKRLGCVLCPMESAEQTQFELKRFPKFAGAWQRACYRYYEYKKLTKPEVVEQWNTKEDMWRWWLSRKSEPKVNEAQCIMFDN